MPGILLRWVLFLILMREIIENRCISGKLAAGILEGIRIIQDKALVEVALR